MHGVTMGKKMLPYIDKTVTVVWEDNPARWRHCIYQSAQRNVTEYLLLRFFKFLSEFFFLSQLFTWSRSRIFLFYLTCHFWLWKEVQSEEGGSTTNCMQGSVRACRRTSLNGDGAFFRKTSQAWPVTTPVHAQRHINRIYCCDNERSACPY